MSTKNKGAILFIIISLLSVLSWSIFTGSFVIKNYYNKIFTEKKGKNLEEIKNLSDNFYKLYIKNLNDKGITNIADYLLKRGEKDIWEENFEENFSLTDSGYYIKEIYIKKSNDVDTLFKKIYSDDGKQKNNYFRIIKNFSFINNYNTIKIILKKEVKSFKIGDLERYWIDIIGKVEIKYFFKGSRYPFEDIKKSQGDINVKIFEKRDNNFKN